MEYCLYIFFFFLLIDLISNISQNRESYINLMTYMNMTPLQRSEVRMISSFLKPISYKLHVDSRTQSVGTQRASHHPCCLYCALRREIKAWEMGRIIQQDHQNAAAMKWDTQQQIHNVLVYNAGCGGPHYILFLPHCSAAPVRSQKPQITCTFSILRKI